jgi:hypothetical protein
MHNKKQAPKLFFSIFDPARQKLLPLLAPLKSRFYLAGGTALALQKGHRNSIDFDFFTVEPFDPAILERTLKQYLAGHDIIVTQREPNTLSLEVDKNIRLSFFTFEYTLVKPLIKTPDLNLASITDIGAMKLSAITQRSTLKDYIDLFVILHDLQLKDLLAATRQKFPTLDTNVVLKSLVYFEDIEDEPITFQPNFKVNRHELEQYIRERVRAEISA